MGPADIMILTPGFLPSSGMMSSCASRAPPASVRMGGLDTDLIVVRHPILAHEEAEARTCFSLMHSARHADSVWPLPNSIKLQGGWLLMHLMCQPRTQLPSCKHLAHDIQPRPSRNQLRPQPVRTTSSWQHSCVWQPMLHHTVQGSFAFSTGSQ